MPRRIHVPRLYAIVDVELCTAHRRPPRAVAGAFLEGGARLLQLRAKALTGASLLHLARAIVADARDAGAQVIVNDRADIAVLAGAAGVHVGQDDLPVRDVRRIVGLDAIVGLSTHTEAQVAAALDDAISYVAVGPLFGTRTKDTGYDPVGLDLITRTASLAAGKGIPVVAIGGITFDRVQSVWDAGAQSAAVISDLLHGDPAEQVARFLDATRSGGWQ